MKSLLLILSAASCFAQSAYVPGLAACPAGQIGTWISSPSSLAGFTLVKFGCVVLDATVTTDTTTNPPTIRAIPVTPPICPPSNAPSGVTVKMGDAVVGTRPSLQLWPTGRGLPGSLTGSGIINTVVDNGTDISIQTTIDVATVATHDAVSQGVDLLCIGNNPGLNATSALHFCAHAASPKTQTIPAWPYNVGYVLNWIALMSGSGPMTLSPDGGTPAPIKQADGVTDPTSIVAGRMYIIWFDGAVFRTM